MPTSRNPSEHQTPNSDRRQWQGQQDQEDDVDNERTDDAPIGDPQPENNRTLRTSSGGEGLSNGQGETGEDEGLAGDEGDDERH